MKAKGVKRISVVTSIGAGDSEKQAPFFFKVLMFTVMKNIFTDKNNQEQLFFSGPGKDLVRSAICLSSIKDMSMLGRRVGTSGWCWSC
mmetsp:Transcript_27458/g.68984  ORF Transcript_27458/g.68984 Transcript_27458/m.68984 type:complete len:88 (+) Transcript_27458:685-948(+)